MSSKQVEFLVKLRDAFAMAMDATNEFLETLAPAGVKEGKSYDVGEIKWEHAEGTSGPYERSEDVNSPDFKALLKDLADHHGKFRIGKVFYWVFANGSTIGRKELSK